MKLFFKLLLTFVLIPASVGGLFYYLNHHGFFNINRIQIRVQDSTNFETALRKPLQKLDQQLETWRGQSLWSLDLEKISTELRKEEWIQSFHIVRHWPSGLQLTVNPERIYFVYLSNKGQIFPVMGNGSFLDVLDVGQSPDLPIATESEFEKSKEIRLKAIEVLKQIPYQGAFSQQTISEIHYDPRSGFSFSLVQGDLRVKMGEDKIRTKSFRVSKVIDYLETKKFQARVIDANLSQKVLVRLRKGP